MSQARLFRIPNRLRQKVLKNGGLRVQDALAQADKALEALREPCLAMIDAQIADIVSVFGKAARKGDEDFQRLYQDASAIIDLSAPVGELEIDRAAFSLCELVDRCAGQGRWDWPSVDVHIDALQLLRLDPDKLPPEARQQIFAGLRQLNDRLPPAAPAEALEES